ncbi:hypothetical protein MMON_56040 [Mycolicibacterium monacense]|uniref:Uncharacterized protein n=1 Tax=Mycolicibacterium monacense TaxID=85693 RepID=A0AAD1J1T8_MYCMB|nr:hypothetical protein MMON_56040 [Mycolicibacterium monacense]
MLIGDSGRARVARGHRQCLDLGVAAQRQQQGMFTGTGSDYQDAHMCTLNPALGIQTTAKCMVVGERVQRHTERRPS